MAIDSTHNKKTILVLLSSDLNSFSQLNKKMRQLLEPLIGLSKTQIDELAPSKLKVYL